MNRLAVILLILLQAGIPATVYWTGGGGDSNWNTGANWNSSAVPGNGDNVILNGSATKNCLVNVNTNNLNSLTINASYTGALTITGGKTLYLGSAGSSGTMTIAGTLNFSGNTGANVATIVAVAAAYPANINLYGYVDWDSGGSGSNVTLTEVVFNMYNGTESGGAGVYVRFRGEFRSKGPGVVRQFVPTANDKLIFTGNTTLYSEGTTYLYFPTYGWIDYENDAVITTQGYYVLIYTAGNKRFYQVEWNASYGSIGLYSSPTHYFTKGITIYPGKQMCMLSSVNYFGNSTAAGYLKIYGRLCMDRDYYSSVEPQIDAASPAYPAEMFVYGNVSWNSDNFGNKTHLRNVVLILKNDTATDNNNMTLFLSNVTIRGDLNDSANASLYRTFTIGAKDTVTQTGNVTFYSNGSAAYYTHLRMINNGVWNYSGTPKTYARGGTSTNTGYVMLLGNYTFYDFHIKEHTVNRVILTDVPAGYILNVVNLMTVDPGSLASLNYNGNLKLGNASRAATMTNNGTIYFYFNTGGSVYSVYGASPLYPATIINNGTISWSAAGAGSKVDLKNLVLGMMADTSTGGAGVTITAANVTLRADINESLGQSVNRQFRLDTGDTFTLTGNVTLAVNGTSVLSSSMLFVAEWGTINYTGKPTLYLRQGNDSSKGLVILYPSASVNLYDVNATYPGGVTSSSTRIGWYAGAGSVNIHNALLVSNGTSLYLGNYLTATVGNSTTAGRIYNNGSLRFTENTGGAVTIVQGGSPLYPANCTGNDWDWDSGGSGSRVSIKWLDLQFDATTGGNGVTVTFAGNMTIDGFYTSYGDGFNITTPGTIITGNQDKQLANDGLANITGTAAAPINITGVREFYNGAYSRVYMRYTNISGYYNGFQANTYVAFAWFNLSYVNFRGQLYSGIYIYYIGPGVSANSRFENCSAFGSNAAGWNQKDVSLRNYGGNNFLQFTNCSFGQVAIYDGNLSYIMSKNHNGTQNDWRFWGNISSTAPSAGYNSSSWTASTNVTLMPINAYATAFNTTLELNGTVTAGSIVVGGNTNLSASNGSATLGLLRVLSNGFALFRNETDSLGTIEATGNFYRFLNYPILVVNGSNSPLVGATVNVTDAYSGAFRTGTTNAQGYFYPYLFRSQMNSSGTRTVLDQLNASYSGQWNSIWMNSSRGNHTIVLGASQGYSLIGNITATGFTVNVTVGGSPLLGPYSGTKQVELRNGSTIIATISHDFSIEDFDLNIITIRKAGYWVGYSGKPAKLYLPLRGTFCNVRTCATITNISDTCSAGWATTDSEAQGYFCLVTVSGTVAEEQADSAATRLVAAPLGWELTIVLFFSALVILAGAPAGRRPT